jgi:hypothetical protein
MTDAIVKEAADDAHDAIEALVGAHKNAEQMAQEMKRRAEEANKRALAAERQLEDFYKNRARVFADFYSVNVEPTMTRTHTITIRPKQHSFRFADDILENHKAPIEMIGLYIDNIVQAHANELKKQLREAAWPTK